MVGLQFSGNKKAFVSHKETKAQFLCGTTLLAGQKTDHSTLPGNGGFRRSLLFGSAQLL